MKINGFKTPIYASGATAGHTENDIFFSFRSIRRHMDYDIKTELKQIDGAYWIICEKKDRDTVQFAILKDNERKIWQFCTNW